MKPTLFLLKSLLAVMALGVAATAWAQYAPKPAPEKPSAKKPADKKADGEEEMGTIEGVTIERANGTFLGLTLEDHKFKLSFYDEKKKPMPVDVARATARWDPKNKSGLERTVLNPGADGMALDAPKFVRPPYNFKIYLLLIKEGEGAEDESYIVEAAGLAEG